jgi:hypothetical protein
VPTAVGIRPNAGGIAEQFEITAKGIKNMVLQVGLRSGGYYGICE